MNEEESMKWSEKLGVQEGRERDEDIEEILISNRMRSQAHCTVCNRNASMCYQRRNGLIVDIRCGDHLL